MNKFTNPLNNIKIASPCQADWNQMIGDDRRRFCGACSLNVYNLSGMSKDEAENLLVSAEGRLCVRFYKRADGTVLTKDCPVGWAAVKRRTAKVVTAAASLVFGILSGAGLNSYFSQPKQENIMGAMIYTPPPATLEQMPEPVVGETEVMGEIAPDYLMEGKISNIDDVRKQIKVNRRR